MRGFQPSLERYIIMHALLESRENIATELDKFKRALNLVWVCRVIDTGFWMVGPPFSNIKITGGGYEFRQ